MTLHGYCCCKGQPTPQPVYRFTKCACEDVPTPNEIEIACDVINAMFFSGEHTASPRDLTLLLDYGSIFLHVCYHLPQGSLCQAPQAMPASMFIIDEIANCEECCTANQCAYLMTACTQEQPVQFWLRRCANAGSEPGQVVRTVADGCYTMASTPLPLPLPNHPFYEQGLTIIANCAECDQPPVCIQSQIAQQYGTALLCNIPAGSVHFDYCTPPDVPPNQRWCGRLRCPGDSFAVTIGGGGGVGLCGPCSGGAGYVNFNAPVHTPVSCCGSAPVFTARYTCAVSCCSDQNGWRAVVQYIYAPGQFNIVIWRQCYFKPGAPPVGTYSAVGAPFLDGPMFPKGAACCVSPFDCSPAPQCCSCPPPVIPNTISLS